MMITMMNKATGPASYKEQCDESWNECRRADGRGQLGGVMCVGASDAGLFRDGMGR
jgi:hypothetical protein